MNKRIAVIGGGIGGLGVALALQKLGYSVTLYEKQEKTIELGAGIILGANAMFALDFLQLGDAIREIGWTEKICSILTEKGKQLTKLHLENEQDIPYTFVLRSELVRILSAALAAGTIVYQKKLIHFKQDSDHVKLAFEDGTCAETDYMIASDGIFSTIRETLLPGHSVRFAGYACWRGIVRHCPAHIAKRFTETWGPKGRFGIVPLAQDRIYWYALKNCHEHNEELRYWSKEDLCYHFMDYHEPIPVLLDKTEQDDIFYRNIYDLPPIKQFAFQRILLIGDAAHATTPNMAQGACQALEDALILALCFDRQQEIKQAFLEYEKIRVDRTRKVIKDSWMIGKVAQLEVPLLCTLRNKMIELAPDSIHTKKLKNLFSVQTAWASAK